MAQVAQEELLDIRVAEASAAYKFYLNQERKILGGVSVFIFLAIWELCGNTFQLINPMFMSAPSLIVKAAWQMFASGEIWNDLYISGIEFAWGYILSIVWRQNHARQPSHCGAQFRRFRMADLQVCRPSLYGSVYIDRSASCRRPRPDRCYGR